MKFGAELDVVAQSEQNYEEAWAEEVDLGHRSGSESGGASVDSDMQGRLEKVKFFFY